MITQNDIDQAIQLIKNGGYNPVRVVKSLSWGDYVNCEKLFIEVIQSVDLSIKRFEMLPEYCKIIDWMVDTKGKGLYLHGDCGRGKTTIITCVIPVLLRLKNLVAIPVHAEHLNAQCKTTWSTYIAKPTNLDYLCAAPYPIIDELGVEGEVVDFGNRYDAFTRIINVAEQQIKPVFISTNLTDKQLLEKYDLRTLERIGRLCRRIEFKGDSLR